MKSKKLLIGALLSIVCMAGYAQKSKIIELPLTVHTGDYGHSPEVSMMGLSTNKDFERYENDSWKETRLKASELKLPDEPVDIEWGDVETNIYQDVYQNYLAGKITPTFYADLQESWNWVPDTTMLSKTPVNTGIVFATWKNEAGEKVLVVDRNGNRDLTDDPQFIPTGEFPNDSLARLYAIKVAVEVFRNNKITSIMLPVFFNYNSHDDMLWCNFPNYMTAEFRGEKLVLWDLHSLSYKSFILAKMREDNIYPTKELYNETHFIDLGGELWRIIGVNTNRMTLILENAGTSRDNVEANQTGFRAPAFEGKEFTTGEPLSLESLRGKYVLLDFWGTWCAPCIRGLPDVKKLYEETSRERFEIVGIAHDSSSEAITALIDRGFITWPQLVSESENDIVKRYNIDSYPSYVLVDPEGFVVETLSLHHKDSLPAEIFK